MPEMFWRTISGYNQATWKAQIAIYAIGILLTVLLYKNPNNGTKKAFKLFLAFCFGWIAIMFFLLHGSAELNKYVTATLFGLISILFLVDVFINKNEFIKNKKYSKWAYFLYILFFTYPFLSFALGKHFPTITTWLMPCPLTVYTIAVLISFFPRIDYKIFVLLIMWALGGLPKIFMFKVPEDVILFISGIVAILVWVLHVRDKKQGTLVDN